MPQSLRTRILTIVKQHMVIILEFVTPLHRSQRNIRHGEFVPNPFHTGSAGGAVRSFHPPGSPRCNRPTDEHKNAWRCGGERRCRYRLLIRPVDPHSRSATPECQFPRASPGTWWVQRARIGRHTNSTVRTLASTKRRPIFSPTRHGGVSRSFSRPRAPHRILEATAPVCQR